MGQLLDALPCFESGPVAHLRPLDRGDVSWLVRAGDAPDIVRWNGVASPFTVEAAMQLVDVRERAWEEDARATFAIGDRRGEYGGYLSLRVGWTRGIGEVGYWLLPSHRGRGLMTDAVRAVCRWSFESLSLPRFQACVQPGNAASENVLLRLGFVREGLLRSWEQTDGVRHDEWMFSLLPTDQLQ